MIMMQVDTESHMKKHCISVWVIKTQMSHSNRVSNLISQRRKGEMGNREETEALKSTCIHSRASGRQRPSEG